MPSIIELLDIAFQQDLEILSGKLGFNAKRYHYDKNFVIQALNTCSNNIDLLKKNDERIQIALLLGLIWENSAESWDNIGAPISVLLSKLRMLPNSKLFENKVKYLSAPDKYQCTANRLLDSIHINGVPIYLTAFQKKVWDALNSKSKVAISAPPSAGKTFIMLTWLTEWLKNNSGICLFVAPTLTLTSQIAYTLKTMLMGYCEVRTCVEDTLFKHGIYILTQEKVMVNKNVILDAKVIIVDEIQNIERVGDENPERSLILLEVISQISDKKDLEKLIISGPLLTNLRSLCKRLFKENFSIVEENIAPVVGITHSFSNSNGLYINTLLPDSKRISYKLSDTPNKAINSIQFRKAAKDFLSGIIEAIPTNEGVIVFAGSTPQAVSIATGLSETDHVNNSVADYCALTVHDDYELTICLKKGIAFHHSRLPTHMRKCIEIAFEEGSLTRVVSTSTLLQGVNFPAKHIFIRHSGYGATMDATKLSDYELANLRGRAGRLFRDFVGRSYLINEPSFNDGEQIELFPKKEVTSSLGERFELNRQTVIDELASDENEHLTDYALQSLISSKILLHGTNAIDRLQAIGIKLTVSEFNNIHRAISSLKLSRKLVSEYPLVDPYSLNTMSRLVATGVAVPDILDSSFYIKLIKLLILLKNEVPVFYDKKFGVEEDKLARFVTLAISWATETPLSDIVQKSKKYFRSVDDLIFNIQSKTVYDLNHVLGPIFFLQSTKNITLQALEHGSNHEKMIGKIRNGLPREVLIRKKNKIANHFWDKKLLEYTV